MKPRGLVLYTRPGCHLCDEAAAMLDAIGASFRVEDIEHDIGLIQRYGDRVPVLLHPEDGAELGWPFEAESLRSWLESRP